MTTQTVTSDPVVDMLLGTTRTTYAPGTIYSGMPGSTMVGSYTANIANQRIAYGFDEPNRSDLIIPAALNVQATSYLKKVRLRGYLGTSVVYEAETWMRVYREIYAPSRDPRYRKLLEEKGYTVRDPEVPMKFLSTVPFSGYGSILKQQDITPNAFFSDGSYQLLWIRWSSINGGKLTNWGVLFDHFKLLQATSYSYDLTPKNSYGYSKSGGTGFSTTGINTYNSNGIPGVNLGSITGQGEYADPNIKYYIQDASSNPIPILQSEVPSNQTIKSITVSETVAQASGPDNVKLVGNIPISENPPTVPNGSVARISNATKTIDLNYIGLCARIANKWEPLYFDKESADTIETHIRTNKAESSAAQFAKTGGKSIVYSGALQNHISANYRFESQPNTFRSWTPKADSSGSFLPTIVVDGADINGIGAGVDGEGGWIAGFAPVVPANPTTNQLENAINAARENYYYVLPTQQRKTAGTSSAIFTGQVAAAASDFTSPSAPWARGFHFGKFLKSSVSGLGFNTTQLVDYQTNLKIEAANAVNEKLATTSFNAYVLRKTYYTTYDISATCKISLRNVEGIAISSGLRGFGNSSTAPIVVGDSGSAGAGSPGAGANTPYIPKDWTKAITDATGKLVTAASVQSLTQKQLQNFLQRQANLGAPLGKLKDIFFESLLEAKVIALQQTQGLSKKAAEAAVQQDPLYLALKAFAKGLKPVAKPTTGGTESGASDSSGDGNPTTTIRINVVRGLPGYRQGIREATIPGVPELVQTYEVYKDGVTAGNTKPRRFQFPFVPREVNYSGIGTRWTEIERTGNYPIVDWNGFQLLKISFNFDIVDRRFEANTGYGLFFSCEDQITRLREMAQTPYPVTFLNMDKFMSDDVRWPTLVKTRGMEFVIAEFTVTAVQRTPAKGLAGSASVPNQISRATCSMTLQEIPIENVSIVQMPPIRPCKKKCTDIPPPTREEFNKYLLLETGVNRSI